MKRACGGGRGGCARARPACVVSRSNAAGAPRGSRRGAADPPEEHGRAPAATTLAPVPSEEAVIDAGEQSAAPRGGGAAVASPTVASWITAWQAEDDVLLAARQRAREVGVPAVDPPTAAALRVLAATAGARHAVELGTGTGVATLSLLRGMRPDGVLTTIDTEPEHQRLARLGVAEAGTTSGRVRFIAGRALDVLPRLSDGAYDLLLCDAAAAEAVDYLPQALRLLRPGGLVVYVGALAGGRVADPAAREPDVLAARELTRAVREEPRLLPALLPVGAGLLVAVVDAGV